MEINYVDPPNRPMDPKFSPSTDPVIYKDTLFMDYSADGHLMVGSTDVTATYWQGSLQVFNNHEDYTKRKYESFYNSPIIFDGKFLGNNKQIISESESKLKVLTLSEGSLVPCLTLVDYVEHNEAIKQIALWKDESKVLTASDHHISQWDVNNNLKQVWDYTNFHTSFITGVDTKKTDVNSFVSVSRDRRVCLWDVRTDNVALELFKNEFCAVTCVAWSSVDDNIIIVGTQAGSLYMLDAKTPHDYIDVQHCYKKSLHKLQFDSDSSQLAVVGDTNELQVYYCKGDEFSLSYKNSDVHHDYIRDAQWHKGELYTCGLQSGVVKHSF